MNKGASEIMDRCPKCGVHALADAVVDRTAKMQYDGKLHEVRVRNLEVTKCAKCAAVFLDNRAAVQYQSALRHKLDLLQPHEILHGRRSRGLTQAQLADFLGFAAETLSRWENGHVIQSRTHDILLRGFFYVPEFRHYATTHAVEAFWEVMDTVNLNRTLSPIMNQSRQYQAQAALPIDLNSAICEEYAVAA